MPMSFKRLELLEQQIHHAHRAAVIEELEQRGLREVNPLILAMLKHVEQAGAEQVSAPVDPITKSDLFLCGLTGPGSKERRKTLMEELHLPEHLGSNALLDALNLIMGREEFLNRYGEKHG